MTKVESFYKSRYAFIQQRLNVLHDHYGIVRTTDLSHATGLELEDLTAAFVELCDALKQLQWYEFVNFNKIVGRLGKFGVGLTWLPGATNFSLPKVHVATRAELFDNITA